ncbi:MAG: helicase HerA-like domain-containing protein, partial [Pseudomonadota bacterium]
YFVTQNPLDVPDAVLAQLGNRIQHALRAYTPREQKAVKTAASTFRQNPEIDTETAITQLGVGEALVSTLEKKGVPSMVQQTLIRPPSSRMGPLDDGERRKAVDNSPVFGLYDETVDRESAFEILQKRAVVRAEAAERAAEEEARAKEAKKKSRSSGRSSRRMSHTERFISSAVRTIGTQIGRALIRGVLGSLKR